MAEESDKKKDPNLPPPPGGRFPKLPFKLPGLPPLPGLPQAGAAGKPGTPPAPSQGPPPPQMPQMPGASAPPWGAMQQFQGAPGAMPYGFPQMPMAWPAFIPVAAQPAPAPAPPPEPQPPAGPSPADMKISELEKRLLEEREKVLLANLKSKEESAVSVRVENSLREIQDKLRRDRRDAESEEYRLKQEARIQELENKIVSERETWVATLRNQLQGGEAKDKETEVQVASRIQQLERRWLDEKARWEELLRAREDELRGARALIEKLKGADVECQKLVQEKKFNEERIQRLTQAHAALQARAAAADERDREYFQNKAELDKTREQLQIALERAGRDAEGMRTAFREREERLLADIEKLQGELGALGPRLRAEHEVEARRLKNEYESDIRKARAQQDMTDAALQRMRAVGGALERQAALLRDQAEEGKKLKEELQRVSDRYKSEFLVLQRKWQDREAEIRSEAAAQYAGQLEAEKAKLKLQAQAELQSRVAEAQERMKEDMDKELAVRERAFQTKVEAELAARVRAVQHDADTFERRAEEIRRKAEADTQDRMKAIQAKAEETQRRAEEACRKLQEELDLSTKQGESLRKGIDDLKRQLAHEESKTAAVSRQCAVERSEREKEKAALHATMLKLQDELSQAAEKLEAAEKRSFALSADLEAANQVRQAQEAQARRSVDETKELVDRCGELSETAHSLSEDEARLEETLREEKARFEAESQELKRQLEARLSEQKGLLEEEKDALAKELRQEIGRLEARLSEEGDAHDARLKAAQDEKEMLKRKMDMAQAELLGRLRALESQLGRPPDTSS
ncbi:MAG: hypothetical protein HY922_14100 [Elusimicrobia bacterium]|nr:hypothetical protein [Elusimicrobiota bacterium]